MVDDIILEDGGVSLKSIGMVWMKSSYGLVYGPHLSRRLGWSLGIDLTPLTCTFDCIYCERGRTLHKLRCPEEFVTRVDEDELYKELHSYIEAFGGRELDSVTFSGTGEPSLDPRLGRLINMTRDIVKGVPITVFTNSSLLNRADVRRDLAEADRVVAKLNAASDYIFHSMHQPADSSLTTAKIVDGVKKLNDTLDKGITIEVMFIRSRAPYHNTNATLEEAVKLSRILREIQPSMVQVHTITRPPASPYVMGVDAGFLGRVASCFVSELGRERVRVYF
ncbi:MAG: radical SAM protein [Candidatus Bathyarchaeia archaeon]